MTGLDAAGTGAEGLVDSTLGSLCEHPESPMAATAVAALSATERCRSIQSGLGYAAMPAVRPTGAMEVTPAATASTAVTPVKPVARHFAVTTPFRSTRFGPEFTSVSNILTFRGYLTTHI